MFGTRGFILRKAVYVQISYSVFYTLKLQYKAFRTYLSTKHLNFLYKYVHIDMFKMFKYFILRYITILPVVLY